MTVPTGIYLLIQNKWLTRQQPCIVVYIYQMLKSMEKPACFLKTWPAYNKYLKYIALMPVISQNVSRPADFFLNVSKTKNLNF